MALHPSLLGQTLAVRAPAKINLFLHVGDRREDGFHTLESLIGFADTSDEIRIAHADELTLRVRGPFAQVLAEGADNLVLRAARALGGNRGAAITLEKNLPVAAGLGGGSADAASALRGLNLFWGLDRSEAELLEIAAGLGSDVPACVLSRAVWMEGRGEVLTDVPELPKLSLVLANPGVMVPTADVFGALNARSGIGGMARPTARVENVWDMVNYLADAGNDLEIPATCLVPVIGDVLDALAHEPGCVLAQMSGSGGTCFGIFQDGPWADGAADRLRQDHPDWWVQATYIAGRELAAPHWIG